MSICFREFQQAGVNRISLGVQVTGIFYVLSPTSVKSGDYEKFFVQGSFFFFEICKVPRELFSAALGGPTT